MMTINYSNNFLTSFFIYFLFHLHSGKLEWFDAKSKCVNNWSLASLTGHNLIASTSWFPILIIAFCLTICKCIYFLFWRAESILICSFFTNGQNAEKTVNSRQLFWNQLSSFIKVTGNHGTINCTVYSILKLFKMSFYSNLAYWWVFLTLQKIFENMRLVFNFNTSASTVKVFRELLVYPEN